MILLTCVSRRRKQTNTLRLKSEQWLPRNGRKTERGGGQLKMATGNFLGFGHVLYFDEHDAYMGIYTFVRAH